MFEPKLGIMLELNGCTIEAYPSNHINAYRALDNPKFILIDEGDFFRKGEQEDVRHVSERYIAKSYIPLLLLPLLLSPEDPCAFIIIIVGTDNVVGSKTAAITKNKTTLFLL